MVLEPVVLPGVWVRRLTELAAVRSFMGILQSLYVKLYQNPKVTLDMFSSATARVIAGCTVGDDSFLYGDADSDESSDCTVFDSTPIQNANVSPRDVGMHPEEEVPCPFRPRNAPTFPKLKGGDRRMHYCRKMSKALLDRTWHLHDNSNEILRREGESLMMDWKAS